MIPHDDRELLILAAKAAGITLVRWNDGGEPYSSGRGFILETGRLWNPLTNDGDALSLAVACGLVIDTTRPSSGEPFKAHHAARSGVIDRGSATRYAIVCAAGEVKDLNQEEKSPVDPVGVTAALAQLISGVESEIDPDWNCRSYHPALWRALKVARTALAESTRPGTTNPRTAAWMTPEGDRVVTELTMAGARKDGGAILSSLRAYSIPLVRSEAERPTSD